MITVTALPRPFDGLRSVDVAELAEAEAISSRWVHIAVDSHDRTGGGNFKGLSDLNVHLEISNGAPVFRSCLRREDCKTSNDDWNKILME